MRSRVACLALVLPLLLAMPTSAPADPTPRLWLPPALSTTPPPHSHPTPARTLAAVSLSLSLSSVPPSGLSLGVPSGRPPGVPSGRPPGGPFAWPVDGVIVRPFDPPPQPWLAGHRGVDIEASESSLVRAAAAGVVWFAGVVASRPLVSIAHPNGTRTTYEPVTPLVSAGDPVAAGDVIGVLLFGHPGCTRACLHWGLRQGDTYLDPLSLLGLGRVRLLPRPRPARVS